jgi:hypothetical protein
MKGVLIVAAAAGLAIAAGVLIPEPQPRIASAPRTGKGSEMRIVRVGANYDYAWKATAPEHPKN